VSLTATEDVANGLADWQHEARQLRLGVAKRCEALALLRVRQAGDSFVSDLLDIGVDERERIMIARGAPLPCAVLDKTGAALPVEVSDIARFDVNQLNWQSLFRDWLDGSKPPQDSQSLAPATGPDLARPSRPYPGLRPFEEAEWSIFFGRERIIDEVIDRLAVDRLVLIHGASGSGKSSLVRAGVLPKLARQYERHGAPWLTCAMRPSGGPLWNLAAALTQLENRAGEVERIGEIAGWFSASSTTLASVAASLEGVKGKSLCLLVDQFEELFRFEEVGRDEAELFVNLIERSTTNNQGASAPDVDIHVILTMRSEFIGECGRFAGFAETINRTQYLVPRMDDDALTRAVRRPAQIFGAMFDQSLATRLIYSVRGREDELPLLQHGLMMMWDAAETRAAPSDSLILKGELVEKAGGLAALLSGHADEVVESVAPGERGKQIVEATFRALTDANAEGAAIRRPLAFEALCAVTGAAPEELWPILDALRAPGVSFLTPYLPTSIGEKTPIDISHEALIRCWNKVGNKPDGWLQREIHDGQAWRTLLYQADNFTNDRSNVLSEAASELGEKRLRRWNQFWAERYGGGWSKVEALVKASREHWKKKAEKEEADRQRELEDERRRREAAEQSELAAKKAFAELVRPRLTGRWMSYLFVILVSYMTTVVLDILLVQFSITLQNLLFDQYQRWKPRPYAFDQPVRIVAVDDESLKRLGQWPWPRERLGVLVDALKGAGVAAIAFDFLFSEKDQGDAIAAAGATPDEIFARAIDGAPVVLDSFISELPTGAGGPAKAGFVTAGDDPAKFLTPWPGLLAPVPELAQHAAGVGFVNWRPDADRVVRKVPLILNVDGALQPSLAMEALRVAQGASTYIVKSSNFSGETAFGQVYGVLAIRNGDLTIPTEASGDITVYFARADSRRTIPAWKALEPGTDLSDLRGSIVFFGASAALLSDIVATPLSSAMPGVEAQAQIVEQLLSGETLRRPDWAPSAELLAGTALALMLAAFLPFIAVYWTALLGFVATAVLWYVSWRAFSHDGILLSPLAPSLIGAFVFLAGGGQLYSQRRQQDLEIRDAFGRFVSPAVAKRLAEHPENLQLGGEQRNLTLMFCAVHSFTTLSERFTAIEMTTFLSEYLSPMTNVILEELGTLDKYMGDAIIAFWNAPLDDPKHAAHAVRAALQMRTILAKLNKEWKERAERSNRPFKDLKFGIGLNTGECIVGNMGSSIRFDYSAIGLEVNIALENQRNAERFGVDIVADETTRQETLGFAWLEIDRVVIANHAQQVGIYTLAGDSLFAAGEEFKRLSELHEGMLNAYREHNLEAAKQMATAAALHAPREITRLYAYYQKRFQDSAKNASSKTSTFPVVSNDP
jgi:adenylate cyclase